MSADLDLRLSAIESCARADGHDYQVARNPVFDAVIANEHALKQLHTAQGLLQGDPYAAFKQAIKPFTGCVPPKNLKARIEQHPARGLLQAGPTEPLPVSYDAEADGLVPPVRGQASCGSCWDFSGTGTSEGAFLKANPGTDPATVDFSEQEVLDCGSNGGCNGDWPETALQFWKNKGITRESDVPYRATSGSGRCSAAPKIQGISDYGYVGTTDGVPSTDDLKRALIKYGPLAVAVAVDDAWMSYSSGIFDGRDQGINHAVILVGWTTVNGRTVWRVRNSWLKSWGEKGYMRCYAGANLIGYGAMYAVGIPSVKPNPGPSPDPKPDPDPKPTPDYPVSDVAGTAQGYVTVPLGGFRGSVTVPVTLAVSGTATPRKPTATDADCGCKDKPYEGILADDCQCDDCDKLEAAPLNNFGTFFEFMRLAREVYALLQSGDAQTVADAIAHIIADGKAKDFPRLIGDLMDSLPAMLALVAELEVLIASFQTKQIRLKARGDVHPSVAFGKGEFAKFLLDNLPQILAIIAAIIGSK